MSTQNLWDQLDPLLAIHAPSIAQHLRPPATQEDIVELERVTGISLPPDLKQSYLRHDGCDPKSPNLFGSYRWMSLKEALKRWRETVEAISDDPDIQADEADSSMGPVVWHGWWRPGWLPIAKDCANWILVSDMTPGPQGHAGQIIKIGDAHCAAVVATGLSDYLGELCTLLSDGKMTFDAHSGQWKKLSDPTWMSPYGWRTPLIQY